MGEADSRQVKPAAVERRGADQGIVDKALRAGRELNRPPWSAQPCRWRARRHPRSRLANAWPAERQRRRRAAITPRQLRLVGDPAMVDAIGISRVGRFAAEMEIRLAGMAHRPA